MRKNKRHFDLKLDVLSRSWCNMVDSDCESMTFSLLLFSSKYKLKNKSLQKFYLKYKPKKLIHKYGLKQYTLKSLKFCSFQLPKIQTQKNAKHKQNHRRHSILNHNNHRNHFLLNTNRSRRRLVERRNKLKSFSF